MTDFKSQLKTREIAKMTGAVAQKKPQPCQVPQRAI